MRYEYRNDGTLVPMDRSTTHQARIANNNNYAHTTNATVSQFPVLTRPATKSYWIWSIVLLILNANLVALYPMYCLRMVSQSITQDDIDEYFGRARIGCIVATVISILIMILS